MCRSSCSCSLIQVWNTGQVEEPEGRMMPPDCCCVAPSPTDLTPTSNIIVETSCHLSSPGYFFIFFSSSPYHINPKPIQSITSTSIGLLINPIFSQDSVFKFHLRISLIVYQCQDRNPQSFEFAAERGRYQEETKATIEEEMLEDEGCWAWHD